MHTAWRTSVLLPSIQSPLFLLLLRRFFPRSGQQPSVICRFQRQSARSSSALLDAWFALAKTSYNNRKPQINLKKKLVLKIKTSKSNNRPSGIILGRSGDKMCLSPTLKTYCTVEFADGDTSLCCLIVRLPCSSQSYPIHFNRYLDGGELGRSIAPNRCVHLATELDQGRQSLFLARQ